MSKYKAIIVIDFDGTIVENAYPNIGDLKEGAQCYINKLFNEGYGIVINTCRSAQFEGDARKYLNGHQIKYHYINCNFPHMIEHYGMDCRKLSGDVYIDDKCLMGLPDTWKEIYNIIKKKFENV